jgi:hypothetical protein
MKVLSIQQPYATLVMHGIKQYETRNWYTSHRGPLFIHASKNVNHRAAQLLSLCRHKANLTIDDLPTQAILGTVDLVACKDAAFLQPSTLEYRLGYFTAGNFAWQIANPTPLLLPFNTPGQQGLWDIDEDAVLSQDAAYEEWTNELYHHFNQMSANVQATDLELAL